jgi:hypothetical protein
VKDYVKYYSCFIIFVLLLFLSCSENSIEPEEPDISYDLSILFIGNSYTYYHNMPETFSTLSQLSGKNIYTDTSTRGGKQISYFVKDSSTLQKIHERHWDFIVFQQYQLITESEERIRLHLDYAIKMDSIIHQNYAQTKTILFMEQAYSNGDRTYDSDDDYYKMTERVIRGSISYANQMGSSPIIAPVAAAWQNVYKSDRDYEIHMVLHDPDGAHPSAMGAYVTACTFYATVFRETLNQEYYANLDFSFARSAQRIASATVLDSLHVWNNYLE